MVENLLNTVNSFKRAIYIFFTRSQSFCQLLDVFPFSTLKIPADSLPDDLTLSLVASQGRINPWPGL